MAKKQAVVDIDIQGLNSIAELEDYLSDINDELKNIDVNSDAFSDMSNNAAQAAGKLKDVNSKLEGVTSTEKAEGVLKLGEGFAGAFAAVQGLSLALGENNEELEKTIAKVGGLILALDGVRKVTEAFSAENVKKLRGVGRDFKRLVKTVKASSMAMKASLIATGVGALVVGVGLLIANWDKLKGVLNGTQKQAEKAAESEASFTGALLKQFDARYQTQVKLVELIKEQNKHNEDAHRIAQKEFDLASEATSVQFAKIKALEAEIALNDVKLKKRRGLGKEERLALQRQQDVNKFALKTLEFEGDKLAIIAKQKSDYLNIAREIKEQAEGLKDSEVKLVTINSQLYNQRSLYLENKKIIVNKIKSLDLILSQEHLVTDELLHQRDVLYAQGEALVAQEQIRITNAKKAIEELDTSTRYEESMNRRIGLLEFELRKYDDQLQQNQEFIDSDVRRLELIEGRLDLNNQIAETRQEIINFDKKGLEIFNEFYDTTREINEEELERLGISEEFEKLSFNEKTNVLDRLDAIKQVSEVTLDIYETELENSKFNENNLNNQINQLKQIADLAENRTDDLVKQRQELEKQLNQQGVTLEQQLDIKNQIAEVNSQIDESAGVTADSEAEINALNNEIYQIKSERLGIEQNISQEVKNTEENEKQISLEIKQQARLSSQLKGFAEDYNEEIAASAELIAAGFELWAALAERQAEMARRDHEQAMENLEEISDKQKENADEQEDLEELLKDANGSRYDEIVARLAEIAVENEGLAEQEAEYNQEAMAAAYQMEVAEWKAEKRRKAAALIDATISGILAVVKALPNVVLAALVGTLSATSLAVIAAQPISPKPEKPEGATFAEGGYTGDGNKHDVAGIVHKGEYVVPKSIVSSDTGAEMIGTLEAMRMGFKGYADGGLVAPTTAGGDVPDFSQLAEQIATSLRMNPSVVSVVDITDKQNRVKVIQGNASL